MVLDDAYQVVRVLADGPSGRTELVTLDGEGPLVRKRIPAAIANASAWAQLIDLDEPLLLRIESLYRMPDELVVVYTYVPGESLRDVVQRTGALQPARVVSVACDLCHALAALHARGVVHRDITPGNVILAQDGAHLLDLGIARRRTEGQGHDTTHLGTWGFAAPEQFGFAQTDARSDVYGLGRLMGYMLTGVLPSDEAFERLLAEPSAVDARLARVVAKATAFEPSARYQSADELGSALRASAEDVAQDGPERFSLHDAAPAGKRPTYQPTPVAEQPQAEALGRAADAVPGHGDAAPLDVAALDDASHATYAPAPRTFSDAPLAGRVAAVVAWVASGVWALILVVVAILELVSSEPNWGPAQQVMALIAIGGVVLFWREVYETLTLRGDYRTNRHPLRLLLKNVCILSVVIFIIFFLVGIILPSASISGQS